MTENASQKDSLDLAEYALEVPLACPHCQRSITTLLVVRLLRTRVNFISTLPRRGHILVCPECRGMLSGDLGGMA
jgi:uncharacterized protein YbaR (Trm112 family)